MFNTIGAGKLPFPVGRRASWTHRVIDAFISFSLHVPHKAFLVKTKMITQEEEGSSDSSLGFTQPRVVKYAYKEFKIVDNKWMATCKKCKKRIQDQFSVTSAFTK